MDTPPDDRRSDIAAELASPRARRLRAAAFGTAGLLALALAGFTGAWGIGSGAAPVLSAEQLRRVDAEQLIRDLSVLAHDSMEGRRAGSEGIARARAFLLSRLGESGISPVAGKRTQEFPIGDGVGPRGTGVNVLGIVPGREFPDRYIVVSAHYDHLGVRNGEIFNGADDNASGTAAILALASYLAEDPPRYSHLFVAFDAEEGGLRGARAFVSDPPVPLESVLLNVNLDMVGHSEEGELYAAGPYHYPELAPLVEETASRAEVTLLMGHDSPALPARDDWTGLSDHAAFHAQGIPFVYFGVEDHEDYHRPSDTFESLTLDFYAGAVEAILDFILRVDREGDRLF